MKLLLSKNKTFIIKGLKKTLSNPLLSERDEFDASGV
jgi:hypothetical protein